MGHALLKEAEDWVAQPIIPQGVATQRDGVEGLKRIVDDLIRHVIRDRTQFIQLQTKLTAVNREQLDSVPRDELIITRMHVISAALAMQTVVDNVRAGFAQFKEDLGALRRTMPFRSSEQRRYFRRLDGRMIDGVEQSIRLREQFVAFLQSQHIPEMDNRLRQLANQQRSLDEIVTNLIHRYPTVSEYLAR